MKNGIAPILFVPKIFSYRKLVFTCTLFSGATGLIFQVVWQKYLSFLVGSEARSVSLVVAIFLLGLALGYRFWGKITEWDLDRCQLVKTYGCIEFSIGLYVLLFPSYFPFIKSLAYSLPNSVFVDMAITLLLLFVPTFLMGATIPMLTKAVPETLSEVNECHAKIYGTNTLGAFLGTFLAGFFLIFHFGLADTLFLAGCVNMVIGVLFFFNPYKGAPHKQTEFTAIPNSFSAVDLYLYVFVMGAVSISFEILFVRILSLTIGSSSYVFPIVLGIFVLGLALGSLSIKGKNLSVAYLFKQLTGSLVLAVAVYLTVPFWPYWTSTVKVSLASLPSNFYVFLFLMILFTALFLLPFLIFMGKLLPLGYALADKSQKDYGKICGSIYFFNTVGTVFGAIVMGYLLLYFFSIDQIYKINVGLILMVTAFFLFREKYKKSFCLVLLALGVLAVIPSWNRDSHAHGLFRSTKPEWYHFTGFFRSEFYAGSDFPFFEDGPNTTVSVLASTRENHKSIVVNGKSDSNTSGDYSTVTFAATIPYLFGPERKALKASVVGLGTGITAGLLGIGREINRVDVLEIAGSVIKAAPHFRDFNHGLLENPKIHIHEMDAFKYFAKLKKPVDIIISEPSNPWVVGVENLFTLEFYKLAKKSLTPEGVFFQWVQTYEMNEDIFYAIIDNMAEVFDHVKVIQTAQGDVGILASAGNALEQPIAGRFWEPEILASHHKLGLDDLKYLPLITVYTTEQVRWLRYKNILGFHDIETPRIGYLAAKHQFLGTRFHPYGLIHSSGAPRWLSGKEKNFLVKKELIADWSQDSPWCQTVIRENSFICNAFREMKEHLRRIEGVFDPARSLGSYSTLRDMGFYPQNLEFLARVRQKFFQSPMPLAERQQRIEELAREYTLEQKYSLTREMIAEARREGIFSDEKAKQLDYSMVRLGDELKIQMGAYHTIQKERL